MMLKTVVSMIKQERTSGGASQPMHSRRSPISAACAVYLSVLQEFRTKDNSLSSNSTHASDPMTFRYRSREETQVQELRLTILPSLGRRRWRALNKASQSCAAHLPKSLVLWLACPRFVSSIKG